MARGLLPRRLVDSRDLLRWWFETDHWIERADRTQSQFRYYFAQREAVGTVIWLFDVRRVRVKYDLIRFDASGAVSANMFDEAWPRFVCISRANLLSTRWRMSSATRRNRLTGDRTRWCEGAS